MSKAQRILGTDNDLNIDSPVREDSQSWRYTSSRSSGMSISISESTQSTNDTGSTHESQSEQWDHESGVFPRGPRLRGKASSTVLGQRYGDDGATTASNSSARLRNADSSSTLKSYYDRQKSPLSISQQTSASSARDLALRKGFPPVTLPRSPLLQVDSFEDPFDKHFAQNGDYLVGNAFPAEVSREKPSRKKPARLDLSNLFTRSKSRRNGDKTPDAESVSISSSIANPSRAPPTSGRGNKLRKAPSGESLQSQKHSIRSTQSHDPKHRQTNGTLDQLYEHYEQLPTRSTHMDRIPESRVPSYIEPSPRKNEKNSRNEPTSKPTKNRELIGSPVDKEAFSWKNVRASMISPPWEVSSAASISSRNTKTSRHTSTSILSNSDLKQRSVLSLSSESEGEDSDAEPMRSPISPLNSNNKASRVLNGSSQKSNENVRKATQHSGGVSGRSQGHRKGAAQGTPFLTIPESSSTARLSGPWSPPTSRTSRTPSSLKETRHSSQKDKISTKRASSVLSGRSSQQPTPPLSPTSVEFRQSSERSSRFMAVTKQEEALLEALRQKRARMREEIIEEHETAKSPPRIPERSGSRYSASSSVNTVRGVGASSENQRILLFLDAPLSESQRIDTSEPSPDLSDFLSFGSDEDSTPRTSWAPTRKGQPRPDSAVSPHVRGEKFSPMTPPSAARLSAVGAMGGFKDERASIQGQGSKKRNTGVRFVDDAKLVSAQDFLFDENETEVIWGL
jgi:hypothetical protein